MSRLRIMRRGRAGEREVPSRGIAIGAALPSFDLLPRSPMATL
jgi:hypothetical protein